MLPNLLVIGARKAGTTSLHNHLALHPEISMSDPKEPDFFTGPGSNWDRGVGWYESLFDPAAPVRGESSPTYTAYPYATGVPERVRELIPDARLIYIVRDPIERMLSEYAHRWALGYERRPVGEVFGDPRFEGTDYVVQSKYLMQLERYLEHFASTRVHVVDLEELRLDPSATMDAVFRFLGVDPAFRSDRLAVAHNPARSRPLVRLANVGARGRARPSQVLRSRWMHRLDELLTRPADHPRLEPSLRRRVAAYVAEDAAGFRELVGRGFRSWTV